MLLCPISSCTVRRSTPAITRRLAKVCRRQCQEKLRIFAFLTAGSNQYLGLVSGPPSALRITGPEPSLPFPNSTRAAKAGPFSGTCLISPFFGRGMVRIRRARFTFSHCMLYNSPKRSPVFNAKSNSGKCRWQVAETAARKRTSSSSESQRTRALFSGRCFTSRAGFSFTLPLSIARRKTMQTSTLKGYEPGFGKCPTINCGTSARLRGIWSRQPPIWGNRRCQLS